MSGSALANPYLTNELSPPPARSYRYRQWVERGYQAPPTTNRLRQRIGRFDRADGVGREPRPRARLSLGFGG